MTDPYFGNAHPPHGHQHQGYGQPGYGQPGYGQPGYGSDFSQPGYAPPPPPGPHGYVSYGQGAAPPNIYVPSAMPVNSELRKLEDDSQLWLLVAAAGFWFGFGWITGPLAWFFGSKIRSQYRALGHHPCSSANWARGLGIASTLIYYLGMLVVIFGIMLAFGALAL